MNAFLLGGVGGKDLFTLKKVKIEPRRAGTNHTMFMSGIRPGLGTNIGVMQVSSIRRRGMRALHWEDDVQGRPGVPLFKTNVSRYVM